jgi:hypothetical protein
MRIRILVGIAAIVGIAALGSPTVRGAASLHVCCVESHPCCDGGGGNHADCQKAEVTSNLTADKQWAITKFTETVRVNGRYVTGPVLIVHDMQKMAKGEPCTTFYRFDPVDGPKEELVSFHCLPRPADRLSQTTFKTAVIEPGVKTLVEYQIAGDNEAHGIPR